MVAGPSCARVLHLGDPPPTAEGRPNPPLQRASKAFYKQPEMATADECLTSHVMQIEQRQNERRSAQKEARVRHVADMNDLRDRVGASFEEQAARRAWHKQIATDQLHQTDEKLTTALLDYKESHTGIEYWPYEVGDGHAFVLPDKKVYGAELLAASRVREQQKALQKAMRKGGSTSLRLRKEREQQQQQRESSMARSAPGEVRQALAAAAAAKRNAVGEQARDRATAARGAAGAADGATTVGGAFVSPRSLEGYTASVKDGMGTRPVAGETYFAGDHVLSQMGRMQLKEAQREIRSHQNKVQLREVLASQAAEKRMRELRDHALTYGEPIDAAASLARVASKASVGPNDGERRAMAGAARRAELESAIEAKRRERHALRKAQREAQRQLDDAAAQEEVLVFERDRYRRREKQTEMALELTKQEARREAHVRREAAIEHAAEQRAYAASSGALPAP